MSYKRGGEEVLFSPHQSCSGTLRLLAGHGALVTVMDVGSYFSTKHNSNSQSALNL